MDIFTSNNGYLFSYRFAEEIDEIVDHDLVIQDVSRILFFNRRYLRISDYDIYYVNGQVLNNRHDFDEGLKAIVDEIMTSGFFPNVFYMNKRGKVDQIVLMIEKGDF